MFPVMPAGLLRPMKALHREFTSTKGHLELLNHLLVGDGMALGDLASVIECFVTSLATQKPPPQPSNERIVLVCVRVGDRKRFGCQEEGALDNQQYEGRKRSVV